MSIIAEIHKDLEQGMVRLMAEYRDCLFAEAVRLCNDASLAEDLVSRTFAKAIQKIDLHDESCSLAAWLKTILVNLYRDDLKNSVVRGTVPVDAETLEKEAGEDWSSDDQILKNSDNEALRAAMDRLDPKYKQILVMHYFSELPVKAIAYALNMPVGTVLWRLNIARKILAKDLAVKLGKKKPLAILAGCLLLGGALFGAWQAGLGEWIENTLSSAGESAESSETISNQQEIKPMHKLKRITLATAVAASAMTLTASAEVQLGEKTDTDCGWTRTYTDNGTAYVVEAYTKTNPEEPLTFTVPEGVTAIDYLAVGGGGAGGTSLGGGGGAGGMLEGYGVTVDPLTKLTITVGAGGEAVACHEHGFNGCFGNNGQNSSITLGGESIALAYGGGGGGGYGSSDSAYKPAQAGGSGGGSSGDNNRIGTSAPGGTLDSEQGKVGGGALNDSAINRCGGGGGGAGEVGGNPEAHNFAGNGGAGRYCAITGENVCYAGGGGGGARADSTPGKGGEGGGGDGGRKVKGENGTAGTDGLGGGGGGAGDHVAYFTPVYSGKGGDGIVVIRYVKPVSGQPLSVTLNEGYLVSLNGGAFESSINDSIMAFATVTLQAKSADDSPAAKFTWTGLPAGAETSEDTATVSFAMPENAVAVEVKGAVSAMYTLTVSKTDGGEIGGTPSGTYIDGKAIILTATPDENYDFLGWYIGDNLEANDNPYAFELKGDTAIEARFEKKAKYALTIVSSEHGTITGNDETEYYEGTKVTLTATPNAGLQFVGWGDDAALFGKATQIELTMDAAKTVSAKFGYTLTLTPSEYGVIVPNPNDTVFEVGAAVALTATPNDGCEFLSWQGAEGDSATTVVMMDQDRTVGALYKDAKGRSHYDWGWQGEVKDEKGRVTGYIAVYEKPGKYDLEVPKGSVIDYLVVAGGGSGGRGAYAGGGGAGGMLEAYGVTASSKTLSITVGAGGAIPESNGQGNNGENSSISNGVAEIACALGGGGGGGSNSDGCLGGSGGGAGGEIGDKTGGSGTDGQGFAGASTTSTSGGGGGGGAGGAAPTPTQKGSWYTQFNEGGEGKSSDITGESVLYAHGGRSSANQNCAREIKWTTPGCGANGFGNNSLKEVPEYVLPGRDGIVIIRYAARKKGLAIMFY